MDWLTPVCGELLLEEISNSPHTGYSHEAHRKRRARVLKVKKKIPYNINRDIL